MQKQEEEEARVLAEFEASFGVAKEQAAPERRPRGKGVGVMPMSVLCLVPHSICSWSNCFSAMDLGRRWPMQHVETLATVIYRALALLL